VVTSQEITIIKSKMAAAHNNIVTGAEKKVADLMEQFKKDLNVKLEGDAHVFVVLGASVSISLVDIPYV